MATTPEKLRRRVIRLAVVTASIFAVCLVDRFVSFLGIWILVVLVLIGIACLIIGAFSYLQLVSGDFAHPGDALIQMYADAVKMQTDFEARQRATPAVPPYAQPPWPAPPPQWPPGSAGVGEPPAPPR